MQSAPQSLWSLLSTHNDIMRTGQWPVGLVHAQLSSASRASLGLCRASSQVAAGSAARGPLPTSCKEAGCSCPHLRACPGTASHLGQVGLQCLPLLCSAHTEVRWRHLTQTGPGAIALQEAHHSGHASEGHVADSSPGQEVRVARPAAPIPQGIEEGALQSCSSEVCQSSAGLARSLLAGEGLLKSQSQVPDVLRMLLGNGAGSMHGACQVHHSG
jgi:hypothetical protein